MRMPISRLTEKTLREVVVGVTNGNILSSSQVPDKMWNLVFMPLAMGAFIPPDELIEEAMGSREPPENLEGEPPKPTHPGYPDEPEPPTKPTMEKLDSQLLSDVEWGECGEEVLEDATLSLDSRNAKAIKDWTEESLQWQSELEVWREACLVVDEDYNTEVIEWRESLDNHKGLAEARESQRKAWIAKYDETFKDWTADFGAVFGYMKDTFPRSVNGYPMFYEVSLVHKEDWDRIMKAVEREWERQQTIPV